MYSWIRGLYQRKRNDWHERRADLFIELMNPASGSTVLDLGGGTGELMQRIGSRRDLRITVADINEVALAGAARSGFETVVLREGEPLPFKAGAFDIVFCNSVIEHVTLPKLECVSGRFDNSEWVSRSLRAQGEFAVDIRRIGRSYFVQTPHRDFPIEAHTWLPFVGWLPHNAAARLVQVTDRVWVKYCGYVDWNLLDEEDMRRMFPGGRLHVERVLGLPKSLIAFSSPSGS